MTALPTADLFERVFHAALDQGDTRDMEGALRILIVHDPVRAERLMDNTLAALSSAEVSS